MGRPDELMGGRTRGGGGDPGAGRGGAPRSGGAGAAEAATAGGAGRGAGGAGRAAGAGAGRAAGGGGTETSLAGRLVTRRWRSGVGAPGGGVGTGAGVAGPVDGGAGEAGAPGGGVVEPAPLSSDTRPARGAEARGGAFCSTGSSGWTARRSPSLSAFRRTRSAWASSIEDEWLLTPMPNDTQRSRASLLVRPSSRASS